MTAAQRDPSPADLRRRLSDNLRTLSRSAPSISALCRDLGINRTQFNRYRAGESFPRPDVLWRICRYFNVDARILLEPVDILRSGASGPFTHAEVSAFLPQRVPDRGRHDMPSGFYRTVRPSLLKRPDVLRGLVLLYRRDGHWFLRGYEAPEVMRALGRETTRTAREFRGVLFPSGDGTMSLSARRNGEAPFYTVLDAVPGQDGFWSGTVSWSEERRRGASRSARIVYEHLGTSFARAMAAARARGYAALAGLSDGDRALLSDGDSGAI